MKKLLLLAFAFGMICPGLLAQGFLVQGKVETVRAGNYAPVPQAQVYVCSSTATGTPCTPLVTVYSDAALTTPITQPVVADVYGQYSFYVAPGTYIRTESGRGITSENWGITVPPVCDGNGNCSAKSIEQVRYADQFPGTDIGAKINAAVADCPSGGCVIKIPAAAGGYTFSTGIILDKPGVSLECPRQTRLRYTSAGDTLLIEEGSATPYLQGRLYGCVFDGTGNANAGVRGIRLVDTIGFSFDSIAVSNFTGAGDVGMLWQNEPASYCANCSSGFSERTNVGQVSLFANSTDWELDTSSANAGVSFEYSNVRSLHLQVNDGQVGILAIGKGTVNSLNLQHSTLDIAANVSDPTSPATLLKLTAGSSVYQNATVLKAEETEGTSATNFSVDSSSVLDLGAPNAVLQDSITANSISGIYFAPNQFTGGRDAASPSGGTGNVVNPVVSLSGNQAGSMPGDESISLSGAFLSAGQLNSSILLGGWAAGLGFVFGSNIQHPTSWCYINDPTCFEFYTIDSSYNVNKVASISSGGDFTGKNGTFSGPVSMNGGGSVVSGKTLAITGILNGSGTFDLSGGTTTLGTSNIASGKTLTNGGTILNGTVNATTLQQGGAAVALASQLPLSATVAGSVTALTANTCGDAVTQTVTGATTTMTATASPDANPGSLTWRARVSAANTVEVEYCNPTTGSVTPAAANFNIRVIQ